MRLVSLALILGVTTADFYMHNPAGGNDRNRERNQNRNNGNRLFDSQNNGNGGYPWRGDATLRGSPDPMVYYEGSQLPTEWTLQVRCSLCAIVDCTGALRARRDSPPLPHVHVYATASINTAHCGRPRLATPSFPAASRRARRSTHAARTLRRTAWSCSSTPAKSSALTG
jgi:hypothetical protein